MRRRPPASGNAYVVGGILLLGIYWPCTVEHIEYSQVPGKHLLNSGTAQKIAFTLILLCIYRIGFHVPCLASTSRR